MKKGIHPEYNDVKVIMSDGTEFTTRSTLNPANGIYKSEIDSKNHPFFSDNANLQKKADQVDRFNRRYGKK